ncbi:MAG TPA: O-antigen ligase family protein [Candidatus Paceibacterota bacterium]
MTQYAKWAVLAPLFVVPFLALYISSDLFFPFITGKNFAFRILVEIAFVGYVVLAIADKQYRPQFSWVLASFVLLVLWMIIADAFAVNPHKAFWSNFERMDGFVMLAHIFVLFLIAGPMLSIDKLWRKWWMTFISASALVTFHAAIQWLCIGNDCGAQGRFFAVHQSSTRLDATLGNSEYLAGFLLLAIGITLWQAFETKGKGLRNTLFALVLLQILVLFGTGTRGTFIALIGAAVAGGLLWLYELGKRGRKGALVFLAAVLVFVGGFYAMRNTAFIQESPNLSRFADISLDSLEVRFAIWGMAIEGIQDKPLTGWGHEGFNYVFNTYYTPDLYGQEPWFDRAHNMYLDWAIAGGLPALLLFLILGGSVVLAVYRSRELKPLERVLILSAFVAYGIQGLAVFDNLFTYVPIAMLLAYAHTLRSRPMPVLERLPEVRGASLDVVTAPIALILALLLIYMVNMPTYAAGKDLIKGLTSSNTPQMRVQYFERALSHEPFATQEIREQLLTFAQQTATSNAPDDVKAKAVSMAIEEIQKEIERAPNDARLHILLASFLRAMGQFDAARTAAAYAHNLSPQKQGIIIEQGLIEWQAGKPEAALAFFNEALALDPSRIELSIYVAAGHIISGDIPGGKKVLQEHFGTTTVNSIPLVLAYQQANAWNEIIAILSLRYMEQNDSESGYQLAIAYAKAGRIAEAREQVRVVMQAHPESAQQGISLMQQLGGV